MITMLHANMQLEKKLEAEQFLASRVIYALNLHNN